MIKVLDLIEQEQRFLKGVSVMFKGYTVNPEEVLSKFYLRICEKEYTVDSLEGFRKWSYTIIRNISRNEHNTSKIKVWGNSYEINADLDHSYTPHYFTNDYFKLLKHSNVITDKQKLIIKRRLQGYSHNEISESLKIPVGTSKTAYHHGIIKFRNELREKRMD